MKDFATALYEKVRSSPKTRFQRTWQEAQTWSQSNRTGCQENYTFRLLLWEKQNHTNTLTTPCPEKKIIRPEKQQGSTRRKASNETNCRFGNERSEFLYPYLQP